LHLFTKLNGWDCRSREVSLESRASMLPEDQLASYLNHALASAPSPFARLVFLTSLRDPYTGRYIHEGWASCSSPDEIHAMLRQAHRIAFESVLGLSLISISRELRRHFQALGEVESCVADFWLELEPYREMIPQGCPEISRKLFTLQVRFALKILTHAPHWSHLTEPTSSLLQRPDLRSRRQSVN
jgi:hypothetical protein